MTRSTTTAPPDDPVLDLLVSRLNGLAHQVRSVADFRRDLRAENVAAALDVLAELAAANPDDGGPNVRFVLVIADTGDPLTKTHGTIRAPEYRLKMLLKRVLRDHGFRCVSVGPDKSRVIEGTVVGGCT